MSGAVGHDSALSERYAIERELGRGGMGVVFLARDVRHDRTVAIKFLPAELASAVGAARFMREIRTLARLSHPHILPLHDSGEVDGELYYVMPHVEGESLRQRLERDGPLRLGEALRIARQVADALAYAHARGIVHRDIKPENILLDRQGHAYVADFGIARVLQTTNDGAGLTSMAVRVGSPAYMSPEQVAGERELDGRSDLYSLGCVLFEMLAGEPPFADARPQVVMRRHLVDEPPAIRSRRADAPPSVDALIASLLAKSPDDRLASAEVLGNALGAEIVHLTGEGTAPRLLSRRRAARFRRIALPAAAAMAVGLAVIWGTGFDVTALSPFAAGPPDSTPWVILPLQWEKDSEPSSGRLEDLYLREAFGRWRDLDLVDRLRLAEAVEERGGPGALTASVGIDLARQLDAGRVVHGLAARVGDSVQIDLTLSQVSRRGTPLRRVSVRVPSGSTAQGAYAVAADSLLFGRVTWDEGPEWDIGTASAAARGAYGAAHAALDAWKIERADSLLRLALAHDHEFARAALWLAQLQAWSGLPADDWLVLAHRAAHDSAALTTRERSLSSGLIAIAEQRYPDACRAYSAMADRRPADYAAWLGLAICLTGDDHVIPDPFSPSGWRYRASYQRGIEALRRAFEFAPRSHRLFSRNSYSRMRDGILYTRAHIRRGGVNAAGESFSSRPQWLGDSVGFVPFPHTPGQAHPDLDLPGVKEAQTELRIAFRDMAHGWRLADALDADALHAVALSLEMLGDGAALDTLLLARRLADPHDQLELAIQEVWLRVKLAVGSASALDIAASLADSVLRSDAASDPAIAGRMAALSVLIGRPVAGASYARRSGPRLLGTTLPSSLTGPAAALLVFSAAGAPVDSMANLERHTESAIRNTLAPAEWPATRSTLLERSAILAHPVFPFMVLREPENEALMAPQSHVLAEFLTGDTASARAYVAALAAGTPDMAYPNAAIAAAAGDTAKALELLDGTLEQIRWMQPGLIEQVPHAGALVRAMALKAELAAATGRPSEAQLWAGAVVALWSPGEPAVQPVVERMRRIMSVDR